MGVRFISINDHYDSADYKGTTGGLDVVMKNIVYDYYSKDLSVKVKTAKYQKMKQGKYLGGHVPYGLMKDPMDKHKLIIDPEAAAVPKEEQFIVEGRHEGIIIKEEFLKAQEIFQKQRKTKKVVPKTYPLYRKVKCGTCGRAMSHKTYSFRGENYKYFGCPHAKEQVGEDGCCKRYLIEDELNAVVWSVVRQLLDMTDAFKMKLDKQNNVSRQDNLLLVEKLARLQQDKEKCESDRFANVDQFMAGQLDKDVYQRRRADLGRLAEKIEADIAELEQKLKAAETVKDDSLSQTLSVMKKYSGADELTQAMVQELIAKVVVTDPEHVEIVWKFKDEVRKFIGI